MIYLSRFIVASLMFAMSSVAANAECVLARPLNVPPQPDFDSKENQAFDLGDGSQVFLGRFFIDADGSPHAYHQDDSKALDGISSAGEPGNWWALATDLGDCEPGGTPIVQGESDPAPGYFVSMTSMYDAAVDSCRNQRRYVDSEKIHFVALSEKIRPFNIDQNKGALTLVVNTANGKRAFAIYADQASDYSFGAGSIALAKTLGYDATPNTGGTVQQQNLFVVFKDETSFLQDNTAINASAAKAFESWGGETRLDECLKKLKPIQEQDQSTRKDNQQNSARRSK